MKKRVNKGLSILLSVALLFAMLPSFSGLMASSEGAENSAGEGTETSGYWNDQEGGIYKYADFTPFLKKDVNGKATFNDDATVTEYTITSAAELAGLMILVNDSKNGSTSFSFNDQNDKSISFSLTGKQSFEGKTIKLSAEKIDLSAHYWVPIGKGYLYPFNATVQGNPATNEVTKITGMKIGKENFPASYDYAGLIGRYEGSAISNIGIVSTDENPSAIYISYANGEAYAGGIVGYANNSITISNCYNTGTISGSDNVGGIVGYTEGDSIRNCYNEGAISATSTSGNASAGGIVGWDFSGIEISNCYNTGAITSSDEAGGILGHARSLATISNCYNTGAICATAANGETYAGGIVGWANDVEISDCYNTGAITVASAYASAGGIVGKANGGSISNCYYIGADINKDKGVGNKEDTDYGNNENGVQNLKNILAEAPKGDITLPTNATIANTSASEALRADDEEGKSQKLGAGFKMEYVYKATEGCGITIGELSSYNNFTITAGENAKSCEVKLTKVRITQNKLKENGYTGTAETNDVPVDNYSFKANVIYTVTLYKSNDEVYKTVEYTQGEGLTLPTGDNIQKTGYTFADWYEDDKFEIGPVYTIPADATGDKTFYAKFLKTDCTIKIDNAMQNGTVTSDKNKANEEDEVTLTVTPDPGYKFKEGSLKVTYGNNQPVELSKVEENKKYTFKMPAYNVTVTAEFEKIVYPTNHDVTIDPNIQNGTVTADTAKAKAGKTVTLTVVPNPGYTLGTLTVKDKNDKTISTTAGTNDTYTFKMPAGDVTVTAEFELASGNCEIKVDPSTENATVTPDKTAAKPGETVTVTVEPEDGYEVDKIYVNGEEIPLGADHKFSFTVPEDDQVVITVTMQKLDGWVRDPIICEASGTPRWYYYKDSEKLTGWQEVQAAGETGPVKRYYFNPERGNAAHTGWMQDETGSWYYFAVNNYRDNTPLKSPAEGLAAMWTGWANDGGPEWYYLDATTGKMHTGWTQDGGSEWYYLDATDGNIKLGWQFISGKWYYFTDDKSENMRHYGQMQTGWQCIGGDWYYFYADGAMAANTLIDNYRVDENGRWIA